MKESRKDVRVENIYCLDGRVPIGKAIPFGLQHVLAMVKREFKIRFGKKDK